MPSSFQVQRETIGLDQKQICQFISNEQIEYFTDRRASLVAYGLLVRVRDKIVRHQLKITFIVFHSYWISFFSVTYKEVGYFSNKIKKSLNIIFIQYDIFYSSNSTTKY